MSTVGSLAAELSRITRPDKAAAWDPIGLQVGGPGRNVTSIAVCHEVTESVVLAVEETGADLLVSYHPLLFQPTNRFVDGPTPAGRALRLAADRVSLLVTHTDFDCAPGGTADSLAAALGLAEVTAFGLSQPKAQIVIVTFVPAPDADRVSSAMAAAGAGRIGTYEGCSFRSDGVGTFFPGPGSNPAEGTVGLSHDVSEVRIEMVAPESAEEAVVAALVAAHPYEEPVFSIFDSRSNMGSIGRIGVWGGTLDELAELADEVLGADGMRVAGDQSVHINRVAVLPGSGSGFLAAARRAGAGAIVTGDIDHHRAVAAVDSGLSVVDPGHTATERPGMMRLVEIVGSLGMPIVDLTDSAGPWVRAGRNALP